MKNSNLIKYVLVVFFSLTINKLCAQFFDNIKFAPPLSGSTITITYDLIGKDLLRPFDVKVYCSTDGGKTFKPEALKYVIGDVGKVSPGLNKKIIWDAGKEYKRLINKIQFKLVGEQLPPTGVSVDEFLGATYFTDKRDGKKYKTIKINDQEWMAENLMYEIKDSVWIPNGNSANARKYGYLYNWKMAQNICPPGWLLPSVDDFNKLLENVGTDKVSRYKNLLKGGESGFNALRAGQRFYVPAYINFGENGYYWASSIYTDRSAWLLNIDGKKLMAFTSYTDKKWACSVRCIRNLK